MSSFLFRRNKLYLFFLKKYILLIRWIKYLLSIAISEVRIASKIASKGLNRDIYNEILKNPWEETKIGTSRIFEE